MSKITSKESFDIYLEDAKHPFSGWNFSYLKDRIVTEPLIWSYPSVILPFVRKTDSLLDMGTGGGEFLSTLHPLPEKTFATEAYKPNVPIARKKLELLGVTVVEIDKDENLPFGNEQFELVINRHESYSVKELLRIIKSSGYFITQQVGGKNDLELNQKLGVKIDTGELEFLYWDLDYAVKELEDVGFKIITKLECSPIMRCFDIGAIVFHLKVIPWQIPDFTIEKYKNKLFELHNEILEKGYFDVINYRFLIIAKKE